LDSVLSYFTKKKKKTAIILLNDYLSQKLKLMKNCVFYKKIGGYYPRSKAYMTICGTTPTNEDRLSWHGLIERGKGLEGT
jgi:poly(A) polymerase Pap1